MKRIIAAIAAVLTIAPAALATTPTASDLVDPFIDAAFTNAPVAITAVMVLVIAVWILRKAWRKFSGNATA